MDISTPIQNFNARDTDLNGPLFRHARRCQSQYRALRGGNHTGLSTWGAQEAWLHASRAHLNRRVPSHGNNGVGLVLSFGSLDAVVPCLRNTALSNMVEQDLLDRSERRIVLNNGCRIQLFSMNEASENDYPLELAGYRFDWIWCDGIPDARILSEVMAHSYEDTPVWITFTPFAPPTSEHAVKSLKALRTRMEGDAKAKLPPREPWTQHVIPLSKWTCPWRSQYSINRQIESTPARDAAQRIYAMWEDTTEGSTQPSEWSIGIGVDHGLPGASSQAVFTARRWAAPVTRPEPEGLSPFLAISPRSQLVAAILMTERGDLSAVAAFLGLARDGDGDIPTYQLFTNSQGYLTGNGSNPYADEIAKRALEAGLEEKLWDALMEMRRAADPSREMPASPFAEQRRMAARVGRHLGARYAQYNSDPVHSPGITVDRDISEQSSRGTSINVTRGMDLLEQLNERFHTRFLKQLDPLYEPCAAFVPPDNVKLVLADEPAKPAPPTVTIDRSTSGIMCGVIMSGSIPDGAQVVGLVIRHGIHKGALVRLKDGTEVGYSLGVQFAPNHSTL